MPAAQEFPNPAAAVELITCNSTDNTTNSPYEMSSSEEIHIRNAFSRPSTFVVSLFNMYIVCALKCSGNSTFYFDTWQLENVRETETSQIPFLDSNIEQEDSVGEYEDVQNQKLHIKSGDLW